MSGGQITDQDKALGAKLMALRRAKGLSQTTLGNALGVTFQQIQKYEKGVNRLSAGRLPAVAELLGTTVQELAGSGENTGLFADDQVAALLNSKGGRELMRGYARVRDANTRRKLVALVESIAEAE